MRGEWQGQLAERWGLSGEVKEEQFARLSEGQHPATGEQLVRHQTAREYENGRGEMVRSMEHRAGWDATFSATSNGTCFVQGLKSGAVGAVAVAGVTAVAALVLAPEVVTGALLAGAAYGVVQAGVSVYNNYQTGNRAGLSYNAGSIVGGFLGGGATSFGARFAITGETNLPASIGDFFGKGKGIDFSRPGQSPFAAIRAAFSKGPDLGGGAAAIGAAGAGTASGCQ